MIMIPEIDCIKMNRIILMLNDIYDERILRISFLNHLQQLVSFDAASFFLMEHGQVDIEDSPVYLNLQDRFLKLYKQELIKKDRVMPLLCLQTPFIYKTTDLLPMRNTEDFYYDFLKPQNLRYVQGMNLIWDKQVLGALILFRNADNNDFTKKDLFLMSQFQEHLSYGLYKEILIQRKDRQKEEELIIRYGLTARELEIVNLVKKRYTNREVAELLYIELSTVKTHLKNIYRKLGINDRSQIRLPHL